MNKKGQILSVIVFVGIVVAVFIVGLIMMKYVTSVLTPFQASINQTSVSAGNAVGAIQTHFTNAWDYVIVAFFIFNVLFLMVTAFMVDSHPAFLVFYIFGAIILILFAPSILTALEGIWTNPGLSDSGTLTEINMPITNFIINNFMIILVGIIILSGVIMFAKIKAVGGAGNVGGY
jgi:hypothetical protein